MNEASGEYYLHENGKLIYKPHGGVDFMSPFVKGLWPVSIISQSPFTFATFLYQARQKGALREEINRLAEHNKLSDFVPDWEHRVFGGEQHNGL